MDQKCVESMIDLKHYCTESKYEFLVSVILVTLSCKLYCISGIAILSRNVFVECHDGGQPFDTPSETYYSEKGGYGIAVSTSRSFQTDGLNINS